MSVVICDVQRHMKEEEDNHVEMSRPEMQVHNRQVAKRWQCAKHSIEY